VGGKKKGETHYKKVKETVEIAKEKRRGYDRERLADLQRAEERYVENKAKRGVSHAQRAELRERAFALAASRGKNEPSAADWAAAKSKA